ncbi:hypothetical protein BY996DRAFT_6534294 [Phakopsora pachyrhizi]|nr:hypothetical protein BY996DRAFT_6534294 [Phakopsora pachyrhizi]
MSCPNISYAVYTWLDIVKIPALITGKMLSEKYQYLIQPQNLPLALEISWQQADLKIFRKASWADDLITRRSQSSYVTLFRGSCCHRKVIKKQSISISTTKAELNAMTDGTKEMIKSKELNVSLIKSENMLADCITKASNMDMIYKFSQPDCCLAAAENVPYLENFALEACPILAKSSTLRQISKALPVPKPGILLWSRIPKDLSFTSQELCLKAEFSRLILYIDLEFCSEAGFLWSKHPKKLNTSVERLELYV